MQANARLLVLSLSLSLSVLLGAVTAQDEIVATIQRTNTPPIIDGDLDDPAWANAMVHGSDDFFEVGGEPLDGPEDLTVEWRALYDDDNLYVMLHVIDDEIINDDSCNWEDDSVEFYIDAQNLDVDEFRPANNPEIPAYQLTAIAGDSAEELCGELRIPEDSTSVFSWGINSYDASDPFDTEDDETQYPQGADTSASKILDENNWTFEVAFPWEALEETPQNIIERGEFGFGVAVNDDDIGGGRDTQVMWATEAADLWMRSDTFPSVELEAAPPQEPGDFNGGGELNAPDLDLLSQGQKDNDPAFDLNGDGSTNFDDRLVWVNDLKKTWMGDANLDLEFNSGDLVAVFTAGKFEQDEMASWAEGDWDGDMRFASGDIVAAFTAGGFEAGPRQAAQAVPEPTSLTLILIGMSIAALRASRLRASA